MSKAGKDSPALGAHGVPLPIFDLAVATGQPWVSAIAVCGYNANVAIGLIKRGRHRCAIVQLWLGGQRN